LPNPKALLRFSYSDGYLGRKSDATKWRRVGAWHQETTRRMETRPQRFHKLASTA
jgi:hypothetical protein